MFYYILYIVYHILNIIYIIYIIYIYNIYIYIWYIIYGILYIYIIYTHTHTHTNIMIYYIIVYTFAADLMVQQLNVLFSPQEPPEAAPTECGGSGAEGLRSIKASDFRMGQKLRASECFRMLQNASECFRLSTLVSPEELSKTQSWANSY